MLKNIHQYSTKRERKQAFNTYNDWKNNQIFTHTVLDEDGNPQEKRCSKYVYHAERMLGKPGLAKSMRNTLERH